MFWLIAICFYSGWLKSDRIELLATLFGGHECSIVGITSDSRLAHPTIFSLANLFGGHEYLIIGIVQRIELAHPTIFLTSDFIYACS